MKTWGPELRSAKASLDSVPKVVSRPVMDCNAGSRMSRKLPARKNVTFPYVATEQYFVGMGNPRVVRPGGMVIHVLSGVAHDEQGTTVNARQREKEPASLPRLET